MIYDSSCIQSLFTHLWEVCGRLQRELIVWDQVMQGERLIIISSKLHLEDFSGGPVVGTLLFQCRGPRFYPWSGTRPHRPQLKSCMPQLKQTKPTNQPKKNIRTANGLSWFGLWFYRWNSHTCLQWRFHELSMTSSEACVQGEVLKKYPHGVGDHQNVSKSFSVTISVMRNPWVLGGCK